MRINNTVVLFSTLSLLLLLSGCEKPEPKKEADQTNQTSVEVQVETTKKEEAVDIEDPVDVPADLIEAEEGNMASPDRDMPEVGGKPPLAEGAGEKPPLIEEAGEKPPLTEMN